MSKLVKLMKDQRAGGTEAIKGLTIITIMLLVGVLVIECFNMATCYIYIKTQMDMANRAVYAVLDKTKLADKEVYIDKNTGEAQFYKYLKANLKLNNNLEVTGNNLNIIGPITVTDFIIYNKSDIPATTPTGKQIDSVSVFSRISVNIKPIFFGEFGTVNIKPYILTDVPDKAIK